MLGGVESFGIPNSTVRPFIGAFLGAAVLPWYDPDNNYSTIQICHGLQLGRIFTCRPAWPSAEAQVLLLLDGAGGAFISALWG